MNDEEITKLILEKIGEYAAVHNGLIPLSEFVKKCLFEYEYSYYRAQRIRTGTKGDFYTSSNLKGAMFAELLLDGAKSILGKAPEKIIEIGAEPNRELFENSESLRLGSKLEISGENIFVFSNELLDSRPFDRFFHENNKWEKLYLSPVSEDSFSEVYCDASIYESEVLNKNFPDAFDGFIVDFSFDALDMFEKICSQKWTGLLLFIDYFRTTHELYAFGKGTARRYKNMVESLDIYSMAGVSDLTYSPQIEPLEAILKSSGFGALTYCTQENFFMKNSQKKLCDIVANTDPLSPKKRALMELISPDYFGSVFRCLFATRK